MKNIEIQVLEMLSRLGAVVTNSHFVYTSGKHGAEYIDKTAITQHPNDFTQLCWWIASNALKDDPDIVLGAAVVGAMMSPIVAQEISMHARKKNKPLSLFADNDVSFRMENDRVVRVEQIMLKRGFDKLVAGKRVVIVEDIVNTGKTVLRLIDLVKENGGTVVSVHAICNRGPLTHDDFAKQDIRFSPLVTTPLTAYDAASCPLCAAGVPINIELGHGRQFVARMI